MTDTLINALISFEAYDVGLEFSPPAETSDIMETALQAVAESL